MAGGASCFHDTQPEFQKKNKARGVYVSMTPRVLTGIASAEERKKKRRCSDNVGCSWCWSSHHLHTSDSDSSGLSEEPPGPVPKARPGVATNQPTTTGLTDVWSDSGRSQRTWPEPTQTEPEFAKLYKDPGPPSQPSHRVWLSWWSRLSDDQKVGGSNPGSNC